MFQQFHIPTAENTVFQQLLPIVSIRYNSATFAPSGFALAPRSTSKLPMPKLKQSNSNIVPRTERPQIPDYGISKSKTGLLP